MAAVEKDESLPLGRVSNTFSRRAWMGSGIWCSGVAGTTVANAGHTLNYIMLQDRSQAGPGGPTARFRRRDEHSHVRSSARRQRRHRDQARLRPTRRRSRSTLILPLSLYASSVVSGLSLPRSPPLRHFPVWSRYDSPALRYTGAGFAARCSCFSTFPTVGAFSTHRRRFLNRPMRWCCCIPRLAAPGSRFHRHDLKSLSRDRS